MHGPQLKPNILDEINADTTNAASNPPIEGLKNAQYVSETDDAVLEDEVRSLGRSTPQGAHRKACRMACTGALGWALLTWCTAHLGVVACLRARRVDGWHSSWAPRGRARCRIL